MTNLKKTLAVVLAFAMILSMGFSAFAYTDVAEGTKVAEAVGILSNLNILTGFEDGTFKPDETVTRAQMAAIICRTLGYEDQAKSSAGSTIFNDVAADHWAAGYINVAQSLQIINGYGDGNYGPEDQVTYEQAVKMIVVALGYELDAQAKGGWSTGYLAVASREGITKNANGVVGSAASRGTVAVLVYNSLEVRLMDQKSWTTGGAEDSYGKTDNTILSQYLDVQRVEGIVTSVPFADFAANGYKEEADQMISFDSKAKAFYYSAGVLEDSTALVESAYDVSLVPVANEMAGKKVVAYVGKEADEMTGNFMVYAIAEKQSANTVTVISAAQLATDSSKADDEGVIAYTEVGSTRVQTLDLDETVMATLNYKGYADLSDEKLTTAELATEVGNGIITLISNDGDKQVDLIQVVSYDNEAVIEKVTNDEGVLVFDKYVGDLDDIDTEDEDMLYVVIKDGAVATPAAIAANDTVSVVEAGDNFVVLYVSSKTVTGTVESYDDEVVTIGGVDYELSPKATEYASTKDLSGKEGIFFLNVDGQIAHDEAEASKGNYAIVVAAAQTSGLNGGYELEVVLADGTSAAYVLADKAKFVDASDNEVANTDEDTFEEISKALTLGSDPARVDYDDIADSIYEITVKNGKISKLVKLASEGTADGREYDAENMSYGTISFNEATVIVSVDGSTGKAVEADDITIGTVADFMVDGEGEKYDLVAFDYDNNDIAGLVIGKGLDTAVPQDGVAVVVTAVKTKEIDNDTAVVVTGFQAGEEVTFTVYDEEVTYGADDFAKGDIVLFGVANAEGIVSNFEILYSAEDKEIVAAEAEEDEYYYAGALDTANEPTNSKFYLDNPDELVDDAKHAYVAADGVVMRNAARYTLVDFSEGKTPEVSKKSKGTGLFSRYDSKYDYEVFVRYFDDAQVEVVVYKYAK